MCRFFEGAANDHLPPPSIRASRDRASFTLSRRRLLLTGLASPLLAQTTTTYVYDMSDLHHVHVVGTISTPGRAFVSVYDSSQNQLNISTNDPSGNVTTYAYDPLSRMALPGETITTPGTGTGATYDSNGNQLNITTESGGLTTTYQYDALNRTIQSADDITTPSDARPGASDTVYDALDRRIDVSTSDGMGNTTTYQYDAQSRMIQSGEITTPGNVTSSVYDSANNQLDMSVNDPLGHTTTYTYDALNRTVLPSDTITTPGQSTSTYYDGLNRVIGVDTTDNGVSTMYLYDAQSRMLISQFDLPNAGASAVFDPSTNQLFVSVVPEPSSLCLVSIAAAMGGAWAFRRRRV